MFTEAEGHGGGASQEEEPLRRRSLSGVGQVRAVGDVGGDRCAPAQPSVTPPAARTPGRRPPQRLGAVPERHQSRAPDAQAPASVASLRR